MSDFQKELLSEIVNDWTIVQVNDYITQLEQRASDLNDWIKHVKTIRRKMTRRITPDNGTRGGMG